MNWFRRIALVIVAASICDTWPLLYGQAAARDHYVALGDGVDEAFHNLRGWGQVNPGLLPEGIDAHRRSRYQMLRGSNSVDLFIAVTRIPYLLTFRTEDGICDDSFDVYVNSQGPVYRYRHLSAGQRFPIHSAVLDRALISTGVVTVTFQNVARDSCGMAAVHFVKVEPGRTMTTTRVKAVVDGDTLRLVDDSQLRLIGVDTPEVQPLERAKDMSLWCVNATAVWPMAVEAGEFVREWLGRPSDQNLVDVVLEIREAQRLDKVNRLLAYVYRAKAQSGIGQSLNSDLIRKGYSKAFVRNYDESQDFPNITPDDARLLLELQQRALAQNLGFWGPYKPQYLATWQGLSGNWPNRCTSTPVALHTTGNHSSVIVQAGRRLW